MKKPSKKKITVPANHLHDPKGNQPVTSYEQAFLQMNNMQKRGSKSIYVSSVHHERLTRIVQIIGDDKIPLYAYLGNILEHHFKMFEAIIAMEFDEKYKGLF
jgi:Protein of unknown function (DUF3408)